MSFLIIVIPPLGGPGFLPPIPQPGMWKTVYFFSDKI